MARTCPAVKAPDSLCLWYRRSNSHHKIDRVFAGVHEIQRALHCDLRDGTPLVVLIPNLDLTSILI